MRASKATRASGCPHRLRTSEGLPDQGRQDAGFGIFSFGRPPRFGWNPYKRISIESRIVASTPTVRCISGSATRQNCSTIVGLACSFQTLKLRVAADTREFELRIGLPMRLPIRPRGQNECDASRLRRWSKEIAPRGSPKFRPPPDPKRLTRSPCG